MKKIILLLLISLFTFSARAQKVPAKQISGKVTGSKDDPVEFANIYIKGTTEGAISDGNGEFILETQLGGSLTLVVSFIGYESYSITADVSELTHLDIRLKPSLNDLKEVVVHSGNYQLQSASSLSQSNAVDLVTTAGSGGDLIKAISLLPGTQVSGTDGRLLVRGGSNSEVQSYIDGMHVLSQYTASIGNMGSRAKYSPFLFEGINFSMGGYTSEYSQSLSAILPLDTKSQSKNDKFGVSLMNVLAGGGGTKSWDKGSASINLEAIDLDLYNHTFDRDNLKAWNKPYRQYSGQSQLRFEPAKNTFLKTYMAYDKTMFDLRVHDPFGPNSRGLNYDEDNLYLNSTFNKLYDSGLKVFAGGAFSKNKKNMANAIIPGDAVIEEEQEVHLKAKAGKRVSAFYRLDFGMESMIRGYNVVYKDTMLTATDFNHHITGGYLSNDFNLTGRLFLNLSSRLEYTSLNNTYALLPRAALNFQTGVLNISGVAGLYQQTPLNKYLARNPKLANEKNLQTQLGIHYQTGHKIFRLELYHKKYTNLALEEPVGISSRGDGYSRGADLFINDRNVFKHWEYMLAYSFNDTRKRQEFHQQRTTPSYATRHNGSVMLKYSNFNIKSIIGITGRFASGRPYHDPNKPGYMNAHTSPYSSIDLSYTFLAHKKLIIYASASNIFNRKNVFSYTYSPVAGESGHYSRYPETQLQNQEFYIGFFLTIGKNVAYDASNF